MRIRLTKSGDGSSYIAYGDRTEDYPLGHVFPPNQVNRQWAFLPLQRVWSAHRSGEAARLADQGSTAVGPGARPMTGNPLVAYEAAQKMEAAAARLEQAISRASHVADRIDDSVRRLTDLVERMAEARDDEVPF